MAKMMVTKGLSLDDLADVVADVTKAAIAPLEKRLAALEARGTLKWSGTYQRYVQHAEMSLVTHDGGLWLAEREDVPVRPIAAGA